MICNGNRDAVEGDRKKTVLSPVINSTPTQHIAEIGSLTFLFVLLCCQVITPLVFTVQQELK
jgi:hypothetical protein